MGSNSGPIAAHVFVSSSNATNRQHIRERGLPYKQETISLLHLKPPSNLLHPPVVLDLKTPGQLPPPLVCQQGHGAREKEQTCRLHISPSTICFASRTRTRCKRQRQRQTGNYNKQDHDRIPHAQYVASTIIYLSINSAVVG